MCIVFDGGLWTSFGNRATDWNKHYFRCALWSPMRNGNFLNEDSPADRWENIKKTFNVGSTLLNITKRGIIEEIQKYIDVDVNIVEDEDKDQRDYYVDYTKQEAIFKAERPLDIENIIKYYQGQ